MSSVVSTDLRLSQGCPVAQQQRWLRDDHRVVADGCAGDAVIEALSEDLSMAPPRRFGCDHVVHAITRYCNSSFTA